MKKNKKNVAKKTTKRTKKAPKLTSAVPMKDLKKFDFSIPRIEKTEKDTWNNKILLFTPSRGLVRMEWVQARYAQMIPTNWSFAEMAPFLSPYVPIGYQLADAQNLMAKYVVENDCEWIIYIEDDNILPPDAFLRLNQYINEQKVPVVSGLYWLKSDITEPLLYRGRGWSHFKDWKLGDKVYVDGIPFGLRLEHAGLIKAAWEESEEYEVNGTITRKVFEQPGSIWFDEEKGGVVSKGGTTDLAWCSRIIDDRLFKKAGWDKFDKVKYPFLVDTNIFIKHITQDGVMYPLAVPGRFVPEKGYRGKTIR